MTNSSFERRTLQRRGIATNVLVIVPCRHSPVTTTTPTTHAMISANPIVERMSRESGTVPKLDSSAAPTVAAAATSVSSAAATTKPMPARIVRNFSSSDARTSLTPATRRA